MQLEEACRQLVQKPLGSHGMQGTYRLPATRHIAKCLLTCNQQLRTCRSAWQTGWAKESRQVANRITHICSVEVEMSDGPDAIGRVP